MTAINAIAIGARGRLLVDAAAYDSDGTVVRWVSKAVTLPHLGMVFASRGAMASRSVLAEEIEALDSFEAVLAEAPAILQEAYEVGAFWHGDACETDFDLFVMGWHPGRRAVELYSLSSIEHPGLAPFTFHRRDVILAPWPDDAALRSIGWKVGSGFDGSRPTEKLLATMEHQRRTPGPVGSLPDAATGFVVGGAAVLTEVSEAGIAQRTLRRWPDAIGRPIEPEGAEPLPRRSPPQLRVVA